VKNTRTPSLRRNSDMARGRVLLEEALKGRKRWLFGIGLHGFAEQKAGGMIGEGGGRTVVRAF
jgi:hypothetical protein